MCGIFGVVAGARGTAIDPERVRRAATLMRHRGPDNYGQWGNPSKVALAHLRLAIIDLSPESNQPLFSACGRYVIVFNGEIFNYIEIRSELQALGRQFRTASDTEVLLNAYIQWGKACVSRFNGDWAFAIYDIEEEALFCSRDRFGVKPFTYAVVDGRFIFSSEIKSIVDYFPELRRPNYNVIANYCRNGLGAQHEHTWFEGVNRLPPAHSLIWKGGTVTREKYWDYPTRVDSRVSLSDAATHYRELFTDAVKLRMRSDVAVGTTLSSGVDSGSIVSVLRTFHADAHQTFTATFQKSSFDSREKAAYRGDIEIDERPLVERLATELSLDAHMVDTHESEFVENLSRIIYHLESGHSSPATMPLFAVLRAARNHVTVLLEGQGADELLGGYVVNMFPPLLFELLKRGKIWRAMTEFAKFGRNYSLAYAAKLFVRLLNNTWIERLYHTRTGIDKVFGPRLQNYTRLGDHPADLPVFSDQFNAALARSHSGGLVNLLHYGDALSMANSLESRLPFTDVNLVNYVFALPYDLKMRHGLGKYLHRVAMKNIVPDFILSNPLKFGFNTPLSVHLESSTSPANTILLSRKCLDRGLFNGDALAELIDAQINRVRDNSTLLFRLLSVELWFRCFIDSAPTADAGPILLDREAAGVSV